MEVQSIAAMMIILGLGYWFVNRSQAKSGAESHQEVSDEFMLLLKDLSLEDEDNDLPDGFLEWLKSKEGSVEYVKSLRGLLNEGERIKVLGEVVRLQKGYSDEKQAIKQYQEWAQYVATFKQLNKAQQQHEIERMKKADEVDSDDNTEKLNLLELIHLSDNGKAANLLPRDVELFTLKDK